jgi:hypothetical protein
MGWSDAETEGVRIVGHNGDTGDGMVLLMNGSNDLREAGMDETAYGVMARLVGTEPITVPGPLQETAMLQLLLVLAVAVLQVVGIVRSVVLLLRWRVHPERRSHGVLRLELRLGVSVALNPAWGWTILHLTAGFSTYSLALLESNDVGWAALLSGAVALVWGVVLGPVVVLLALRGKGAAPPDAGAQHEGEVPASA